MFRGAQGDQALHYYNAVFPVYGSAQRLYTAQDGETPEPQDHDGIFAPAPSLRAGNVRIGFVTPYLTWDTVWRPDDVPDDMLLLNLLSSENVRWVLDEPKPDPRERSDENRIGKRVEMMLHILGDEWEECPIDVWRTVTRDFVRHFVRPKRRAEAAKALTPVPAKYDRSLLWSVLYEKYIPVYQEGEAATARYDAQKADRFLICIDFGEQHLYRVRGELLKSFHLARFGHRFVSTDLYVMPEDGSWLYAQNHEGYVEPCFVPRQYK